MESFLDGFLTIVMALLVVGAAVACGVVAVRGLIVLVKTWQTSRENRHWPAVQGRITGGELVRMDGAKAALSYTYHVNGREFEVEQQVFRAYDSIHPWEARKILARYPVDALVHVYYDPENPKNCTLDPGLLFGPLSSLVLLPIFLLMPACMGLLIAYHMVSALFQK